MSAIADARIVIPEVQASRGYWSSVGHRLIRDPVAMVALTVIVLLVLAGVFVPHIARVSERGSKQLRTRDYVEAAGVPRASLFPNVRRSVVGNVLGPVVVYAARLISLPMVLASGLSFLGLGVEPPGPEWGL